MMSFIGSIEYIMQGFSLQALFELIYAEGSVNAILHDRDIQSDTSTVIYTALYGYFTAKLFECNLGKSCNDGKFKVNSSLQIMKELVRAHTKILHHELCKRKLSPN